MHFLKEQYHGHDRGWVKATTGKTRNFNKGTATISPGSFTKNFEFNSA